MADKDMHVDIDFTFTAPEDLTRGMSAAMARVGAQFVGMLQKHSPVYRGRLASSWTYRVQDPWEVFAGTNVVYAEHVWLGRMPGAPPFGPILEWATFRGLNPWAVHTKITQEGIEPNPFVERAQDEIEPIISDIILATLRQEGVIE